MILFVVVFFNVHDGRSMLPRPLSLEKWLLSKDNTNVKILGRDGGEKVA